MVFINQIKVPSELKLTFKSLEELMSFSEESQVHAEYYQKRYDKACASNYAHIQPSMKVFWVCRTALQSKIELIFSYNIGLRTIRATL